MTNEEVLVHANEAGSILKTIWCRSIDGFGMFSGMTTHRVTLSKGKCKTRPTHGRKRVESLHDMMERRHGQLKDLISDRSRCARIASENACQKPACWKQ